MSDFVHVHVHTEFSLLDGLSKIKDLVKRAKELEMPALAITDHGTMFGAIDFYRACKDADIKPLIGVETYLAPRGMEDRDSELDKRPYHLLLLAKDMTGYRNLLKIASESQLRGYYYRPRIDFDFLNAHAEGLVATSGCLAARVPRAVVQGKDDEAREMIGRFQDIFGADSFFLEVQQHDIPDIKVLNKWLLDYRKSGHSPVGLVATSDVHYVRAYDYDVHDTLLCIQTGALKTTPKRKDHDNEEGAKTRMAMSDNSYYLLSADEVRQQFGEAAAFNDYEPLKNSLKIAEMCDINLDDKEYHLPIFPVPDGFTEETYLRHLCDIGMGWRFGERKNDPVLQERLTYELSVIGRMGFNTYFLIVWDLCEFARYADIWWNVRGSGAGSLVAYSLGITNIDPIQNSLLFERFLNPGRVSMPDIDIDYPDDRRGEMIEYTARKYGEDKVAAIITFGTMGAKAAIKDVARVYDIPLPDVNRVVGHIPTEAKQKPIMEYVEGNPDLKAIYDKEPHLREVIDMATHLQGVSRHTSVHAAGVIVADKPLVSYIPLARMSGKDMGNGALKAVTQFPMETAESIGLLKIDFLGLSTLTILRKACDLIEKYHGIKYTMDNIPYRHDDPRITDEQKHMLDDAFGLIGRGETVGVFQLESTGMQQMLRGMRPKEFNNIVAAVALYRPGPMDFIPAYNRRLHGDEEAEYKHPLLRNLLEETYGIIIYQEQIMQIAANLFGYDRGEADLMRKAVSKKREKDLVKHRAIFLERGPEHGVDEDAANKIFDDIEFFANYGFNRAHASDYAVVTVQTAFLKQNYTAEYMTALLSVQRDDSTKVATFLAECRRLNISILPPNINASDLDFTIESTRDGRRAIRFGLEAIKGAGATALLPIIEARKTHGKYKTLEDLCERVDLRRVGKRTLESLIQVGALVDINEDRQQLTEAVDRLVTYSAKHHDDLARGQSSMFDMDAFADDSGGKLGVLPQPKTRKSNREVLRQEKELLGLYITGRPVDKFRRELEESQSMEVAVIKDEENAHQFHDRDVRIAGEIVEMRTVFTKKGDKMAILKVEDWHESAAAIEVVMFPRTWDKMQALVMSEEIPQIAEGEVFMIMGRVDTSRGDAQIVCERVTQQFTLMSAGDAYNPRHYDSAASAPSWMEGEDDFQPESRHHYAPDDADTVRTPAQDWSPVGAESSNANAQGHGHAHERANGNGHAHEHANGNGNGHAHERAHERANGHTYNEGALPGTLPGTLPAFVTDEPAPPELLDDDYTDEPAAPPRWLVVYMPRTGDNDKDERTLKRLHGTIIEKPGTDRFMILIDGDDDQRYRLEFDEKIQISDVMLDEIRRLVKPENVMVLDELEE